MLLIIAVSDVHLVHESIRQDFDQFLRQSPVAELTKNDHLVLVGDIIDFWRANSVTVLINNRTTLERILELERTTNLHYVVGNHDYLMWWLSTRDLHYHALEVRKSIWLKDDGISFFFIHGYELEVLASLWPLSIEDYERIAHRLCFQTDKIGKTMSLLWGWWKRLFGKRGGAASVVKIAQPPEDRAKDLNRVDELVEAGMAHLIYGLKEGERLVFGHTHRPKRFSSDMAGNPGSWVEDSPGHNKYLVISGGQMRLEEFK